MMTIFKLPKGKQTTSSRQDGIDSDERFAVELAKEQLEWFDLEFRKQKDEKIVVSNSLESCL